MDLRTFQEIGTHHIDDNFNQLNFGRGYDHNFFVGKLGEMKKLLAQNLPTVQLNWKFQRQCRNFNFTQIIDLSRNVAGLHSNRNIIHNAINLTNCDKPILKSAKLQVSKTVFHLSS